MNVNFIIRGKNNPTKIICRFKPIQSFDREYTTPYSVKRDDWNKKQQQIKLNALTTNKDLINSKLREIESLIIDKWNSDTINKQNIAGNWLKLILDAFFGKAIKNELHKVFFSDWIIDFNNEAHKRLFKGKPLNEKTIKQYTATLKKIQAFEILNNLKLRFEHIDLKFYQNFVYYCRNTDKLSDNSIGGHIKNIKLFAKNIDFEGLPINQQYKQFKTIKTENNYIYLTDNEIDRIFKYNFSSDDRLNNAKDLFIIGLRTGQRVSDFLRFEKSDLKGEYIIFKQEKTETLVSVVLHPQVKLTLAKRNGEFPRNISDPKFNLCIKEIAQSVGINQMVEGNLENPATKRDEKGIYEKWKLVTSHTCRRSFVTNLVNQGLDNNTIMSQTGHKSEKILNDYNQTTKQEYLDKTAKHYEKIEADKLKQPQKKMQKK